MSKRWKGTNQEIQMLVSRLERVLLRIEQTYEAAEEELEVLPSNTRLSSQTEENEIIILDEISSSWQTLPPHALKISLPFLEISEWHPNFKDRSPQERFEWLLDRCKRNPTDMAMYILKDCVNDWPLCELVGPQKAKEFTDRALKLLEEHEEKNLPGKN